MGEEVVYIKRLLSVIACVIGSSMVISANDPVGSTGLAVRR